MIEEAGDDTKIELSDSTSDDGKATADHTHEADRMRDTYLVRTTTIEQGTSSTQARAARSI